MKLSESTLNVLKNFSTINQGIVFKTGSTLRTISKQQNVMAKATVTETFDKDFAIYDLNRLLALLTSLKEPDVKVNDKTLKITSGSSSTTYGLSDETMVVAPPDKDLDVKNAEVNFTLTKDDLNQVLKLAGVLGLPNIAFADRKNDPHENIVKPIIREAIQDLRIPVYYQTVQNQWVKR